MPTRPKNNGIFSPNNHTPLILGKPIKKIQTSCASINSMNSKLHVPITDCPHVNSYYPLLPILTKLISYGTTRLCHFHLTFLAVKRF